MQPTPPRSVRPIPANDLLRIFDERLNLHSAWAESLQEQQPPSLRDVLYGGADAVIDFISDVRFFAGVWVGIALLTASAFAWGYYS